MYNEYIAQLTSHFEFGVFIFKLIRYFRACVSYKTVLDRGFLLTRKLQNEGFKIEAITLKYSPSSPLIMLWLTITECLLQLTKPSHFLVNELSPDLNTSVIDRVGTAHPSEVRSCILVFALSNYMSSYFKFRVVPSAM